MWGSTDEQQQMHLVAWDTLTKDKAMGGLGIRAMRQAYAAFLTKLGWRLIAESDSLWSRVVRDKYCEGRCELDMFKHKPGASSAWGGIVDNVDILRQGVSMVVGNGKRTLFWHHKWADNQPLL